MRPAAAPTSSTHQAGRAGDYLPGRELESRLSQQARGLQAGHHPVGAGTGDRANLVERGDADLVVDLQASDVQSLETKGKLKVISTPQYNAVTFVAMNNLIPPFDNINVRRAVAYALPYDDMFKAALFGRGAPLFGANWADGKPSSGAYPIPQPVKLDLDKARRISRKPALRTASRHVQLQCRAGVDRRTDGRPGQGIARQDRHQGRYPETAGWRRCRRRSTRRSSFFTRGHRRLAALDRLFLPQLLYRQSALELLIDRQCRIDGGRAGSPLRADKTKYEEDGKKLNASIQRDAADPALAAEPGRGDGARRSKATPTNSTARSIIATSAANSGGRCHGGPWRNHDTGGRRSCPRFRRCSASSSSPSS